jgi:hypothetical protein
VVLAEGDVLQVGAAVVFEAGWRCASLTWQAMRQWRHCSRMCCRAAVSAGAAQIIAAVESVAERSRFLRVHHIPQPRLVAPAARNRRAGCAADAVPAGNGSGAGVMASARRVPGWFSWRSASTPDARRAPAACRSRSRSVDVQVDAEVAATGAAVQISCRCSG